MPGRRARRGSQPGSAPAGPTPVVVAPLRSRREERLARRRQRRRRAAAVLAALAALAGLAVALVLGLGGGTGARGGTSASPGHPQTLLLALQGADGRAAAAALLGDVADRSAAEVLVPGGVVADVPGYGQYPFAESLALPGGGATAQATLADLVGVDVQGWWVLDQTSFARLVDGVGGVTVAVDTAVVAPQPGGGGMVVVPAGTQHLTGAQAYDYATYVAAGEDPLYQPPRLQAVLDALVTALPPGQARLEQLLAGLGGGSRSNWDPSRLAGFAAAFRHDRSLGSFTPTLLPVVALDTGGTATRYRIDAAKVQQLVSAQFPGSLTGARYGNRVFVENAVGTPGLGASARSRLVAHGFRFVGSSNLQPFGRAQSVVLVFSQTAAAQRQGALVAQALGLPPSEVRFSAQQQSVADVVVILGRDYRG